MKLFQSIFLIAGILFLSACSKDEDTPPAQASFEITGSPAFAPAPITCTNTSQNAFRVEWFIDDVGPHDGNEIYLSYQVAGSHKIELKAYGTESWSSVTHWVNVKSPHTVCKIKKMELIAFPPAASGTYDIGDGPDIYFDVDESFGSMSYYGTPDKIDDVSTSDLPIFWYHSPSITLGDLDHYHYIEFFDYDTPNSGDFMGYFHIKPSSHWTSYPTEPILESNGLKVRLTLEWQ